MIVPQGQSRACLDIVIIDDDISESTETFSVFLNNLSPGVNNSAATSTVQIIDDDDSKYISMTLPWHDVKLRHFDRAVTPFPTLFSSTGLITIDFELDSYTVMEGQPTVEVCAVTSSTPSPGQTVIALVSTQDVTATGMCMVANVNETLSLYDFTTFFARHMQLAWTTRSC